MVKTDIDHEIDLLFKAWRRYKNPIQVLSSTTDKQADADGYTDDAGVWHDRTLSQKDLRNDSNAVITGEIVAPNNYKAGNWQQTADGVQTIVDMDWYSRHCNFGIGTEIYVKSTDTTYKVVAKSDYRPQATYAEYGLKSLERQVSNDL